MRHLLLGLALLICGQSMATTSKSPLPPIVAKKLSELDSKKNFIAVFNINETKASGSEIKLSKHIPPKSLITRAHVFVKEAVVSASSNVIAFGCEATNDLVATANYVLQATNSSVEGVPRDTAATAVYTDDGCELEANIGPDGTSGVSDGILYMFGEYINVE